MEPARGVLTITPVWDAHDHACVGRCSAAAESFLCRPSLTAEPSPQEHRAALSTPVPSNFFVRPWLPQQVWRVHVTLHRRHPTSPALIGPQALLQHPSVQVFISHCGIYSTEVQLSYGMPEGDGMERQLVH